MAKYITTTATYQADFGKAEALLADHLSHASGDDEWLHGQCEKWLSDALNDTWHPGLTLEEWAEEARQMLGWVAP